MLIDVHCHLDFPDFTDLDKVIERAKKAGVVSIISNGVNQESNRAVLEIAKKYEIVKPALGFYPDEAVKQDDDAVNKEIEFISEQKPVAIGEVGLDNYRVQNPERQKEVFKRFIHLAEKMNLPIIVHARKAEQEAVELLQSYKLKKVIMHCFSGSLQLAKKIADNGWYFSIPPSIVYTSNFQELVRAVNSTHLLTETDAPFLGPVKGERDEPAFVAFTIREIARIKRIEAEEAENIVFMNYKRIFG